MSARQHWEAADAAAVEASRDGLTLADAQPWIDLMCAHIRAARALEGM